MDSRGQVSAEYLFLILIFLVVLTFVTVPLAYNSITSSQNVSVTSDAQTAVSTLANAVNVVYANGPQSQRTVNVYIPQNDNLVYDNVNQLLNLSLSGIPNNTTTNTTGNRNAVNATVPYAVNFANAAVTKGWHNFQVTWGLGNTTITITQIS